MRPRRSSSGSLPPTYTLPLNVATANNVAVPLTSGSQLSTTEPLSVVLSLASLRIGTVPPFRFENAPAA